MQATPGTPRSGSALTGRALPSFLRKPRPRPRTTTTTTHFTLTLLGLEGLAGQAGGWVVVSHPGTSGARVRVDAHGKAQLVDAGLDVGAGFVRNLGVDKEGFAKVRVGDGAKRRAKAKAKTALVAKFRVDLRDVVAAVDAGESEGTMRREVVMDGPPGSHVRLQYEITVKRRDALSSPRENGANHNAHADEEAGQEGVERERERGREREREKGGEGEGEGEEEGEREEAIAEPHNNAADSESENDREEEEEAREAQEDQQQHGNREGSEGEGEGEERGEGMGGEENEEEQEGQEGKGWLVSGEGGGAAAAAVASAGGGADEDSEGEQGREDEKGADDEGGKEGKSLEEPGYKFVTTPLPRGPLACRIANHLVPPTLVQLVLLPSGQPGPLHKFRLERGAQVWRFNGHPTDQWDLVTLRRAIREHWAKEKEVVWRVWVGADEHTPAQPSRNAPEGNKSEREGSEAREEQEGRGEHDDGSSESSDEGGDQGNGPRASPDPSPRVPSPLPTTPSSGGSRQQESSGCTPNGQNQDDHEHDHDHGHDHDHDHDRHALEPHDQPDEPHEPVALSVFQGAEEIRRHEAPSLSVPQYLWAPDGSHVLFVISQSIGDGTSVELWKRFSEFALLHDGLVGELGAGVVPPLPARISFGALLHKHSSALSHAFLEERRAKLETWLREVQNSPTAWRSPHTAHFFCSRNPQSDSDTSVLVQVRRQGDSPPPAALEGVTLRDLDTGHVFPLSHADAITPPLPFGPHQVTQAQLNAFPLPPDREE